MTFRPLKPQLLAPGIEALGDAPQTQFLSDGDPVSDKEAAQAALAAYAAAPSSPGAPVPPAAIAKLIPASTV
jgi:hypothetical protein